MDDGVHSESEGEKKMIKYSLYGRHTHTHTPKWKNVLLHAKIQMSNSLFQWYLPVLSMC